MKKTSVKPIASFKELYIPNPCHEKWQEMSAVKQNRFCSKCKEVVYDFSEGDLEAFNKLNHEKEGSFCVRFYKDQINQDLKYESKTERSFWSPSLNYLRYIAAVVVLKLSFIRMGYSQNGLSAKAGSFGNSVNLVLPDPGSKRIEKANVSVQGKVLNKETKYFIKGVTIKLYDQKGRLISESITADSGKFYIPLSDTLNLNQKFTISAECEKTKTRRYIIKYSTDEKEITENNFSEVVLEIKAHRRARRGGFLGLGRKRHVIMGKFKA